MTKKVNPLQNLASLWKKNKIKETWKITEKHNAVLVISKFLMCDNCQNENSLLMIREPLIVLTP